MFVFFFFFFSPRHYSELILYHVLFFLMCFLAMLMIHTVHQILFDKFKLLLIWNNGV